MINAIGQFFFRYRNVLFPLVLGLLLIASPPRAFGERSWDTVAAIGLLAVTLGQTLRVITIGLDYIKRGGKKKQVYADRLVVEGVYAHCRNPMYVGNVLVAYGMLALVGQPWTMLVGGAFFVFAYVAIVRSEELYLAGKFGDEFAAFCARSPRWLPRVHGLVSTLRAYRFDWPAVVVKEYGTLFTTAMFCIGVLAYKTWRTGALDRFGPYFIVAAVVVGALWIVARWLKKGLDLRPRGTTKIMPEIADRRRRIDEIDAKVLGLLNKRARQVTAIYAAKNAARIGRIDPVRTERILERLESLNSGPLSNDEVRRLYGGILDMFAKEYLRAPGDKLETTVVSEEASPPVVEVPARRLVGT